MNVAVVSHVSASTALTAILLEEADIHVTHFQAPAPLKIALQRAEFGAVLLEDHADHLDGWLASLQADRLVQVPCIVVGPRDPSRMALALQKGAHDYAIVDVDARWLICRLRARVKAQARGRPESLRVGPHELHAGTQTLVSPSGETGLTSREFALAWMLFENFGRVVDLRTLCAEIWGRSADIGKRALEQHVYKLRRKLGAGTSHACHRPRIQTVYGIGYRLQL